MTQAKVFTLPGLKPERIQELAEAGLNVDATIEAFGLPEPQYGEQTIGELTEEEAQLFVAFFNAQADLEDMHRNTLGAILRRTGDSIAKSDRQKNLVAALQDQKMTEFESEEDEKKFCRLEMLVSHLRASLFFMIAERLDCHVNKLSIRSKRRIVKMGRRLEGVTQNG